MAEKRFPILGQAENPQVRIPIRTKITVPYLTLSLILSVALR